MSLTWLSLALGSFAEQGWRFYACDYEVAELAALPIKGSDMPP
jgi:hypothetical protein